MKKTVLALALVATTGAFANVVLWKIWYGFQLCRFIGPLTTGTNGNAGLPTFNGMPTVGFRYHITDMIAVAPSVGFVMANGTNNTNNTTAGSVLSTEKSVTAWGIGLEIPLYLLKLNMLDFYIAPGVGYTPISTTTKTTYSWWYTGCNRRQRNSQLSERIRHRSADAD
ncbi:MAG: hypothetical protein U1F16_09465 [Turneriella sp.]